MIKEIKLGISIWISIVNAILNSALIHNKLWIMGNNQVGHSDIIVKVYTQNQVCIIKSFVGKNSTYAFRLRDCI